MLNKHTSVFLFCVFVFKGVVYYINNLIGMSTLTFVLSFKSQEKLQSPAMSMTVIESYYSQL